MRQSQLFYKTLKTAPKEALVISHQLLLRGGFISQLASGVYNFLPLGLSVHKKIEEIIRQEMNSIGAQEVFLATLQPKEIWEKTNRWGKMDPPLFKIKDRHNKLFALGSTHEEVITDLVKSKIQSYKDLPLYLYQIQNKFRNEMRFTGGLLRTREFMMKDLYSFHRNEKDLEDYFQKVFSAYEKIFKRCGLDAIKSEASGGVFTKEKTYEFQILTDVGEDKIIYCPKCKWASNLEVFNNVSQRCPKCSQKLSKANSIELGHIFRLGTKYSKDFNLCFLNEKGEKEFVVMGCYGIGLGRLMAAVVEVNHDDKGIIWPKEVAPFCVHLIPIENTKKIKEKTEKIYQDLSSSGGSTEAFSEGGQKNKTEVLYDDRKDKTAGEKFAEADLIGIPIRIVVSEKTLKMNSVEIKKRSGTKTKLIEIKKLPTVINNSIY